MMDHVVEEKWAWHDVFLAGATCSYCTLDYGRLLDVTRLRLFKMRKALKDKLKDRCSLFFSYSVDSNTNHALSSGLFNPCQHAARQKVSLPFLALFETL